MKIMAISRDGTQKINAIFIDWLRLDTFCGLREEAKQKTSYWVQNSTHVIGRAEYNVCG